MKRAVRRKMENAAGDVGQCSTWINTVTFEQRIGFMAKRSSRLPGKRVTQKIRLKRCFEVNTADMPAGLLVSLCGYYYPILVGRQSRAQIAHEPNKAMQLIRYYIDGY